MLAIYETAGGLPIAASERALKFAMRLATRTFVFAIVFVVIRFFQHERSYPDSSIFTSAIKNVRGNPASYLFIPIYALLWQ